MALTDNIVSYWKLDESSGNAVDSVGTNTLTNHSATFGPGIINNGGVFVAASSEYFVNSSTANLPSGSGARSISCWIKTSNSASQTIYEQGTSASLELFDIWINVFAPSNNIGVGLNGGNVHYTATNITDGNWHHIVFTYDGTGVGIASGGKMYMDGSALTQSGANNQIPNTGATCVGLGGETCSGLTTAFMDGTVDEVGVWTRAISSAEVTQLYNGGAGIQYPFVGFSFNITDSTAVSDSASISLITPIPFWTVVVAGGGAGGDAQLNGMGGGGGGAGGYLENTNTPILMGISYPITVGPGGDGSGDNNGYTSSIGSLVTTVGGGTGATGSAGLGHGASNGGSGGGYGGNGWSTGGTGTGGQGNNGASRAGSNSGGGGGGKSGAGAATGSSGSGTGGSGINSSISGSSVNYAAGGGGGAAAAGGASAGAGGLGSGGNGNAGQPNTGGGGGGAYCNGAVVHGGAGGTGVVIIRFSTGTITVLDKTGAVQTTSGGNTILTYNTASTVSGLSGTFQYVPIGSGFDTTVVMDSPNIKISNLLLTVTDSTGVTDTTAERRIDKFVIASDSTAVSDTPTILIIPGVAANLIGSLYASGYKWLTNALLAAQQAFVVRPYFTCQIIDDTIQPNGNEINGTNPPYGAMSMATAPDGTVFAVGLDANLQFAETSNLRVYWSTDLQASGLAFNNSTVLNTTGDNFLNDDNNYSISISDSYNGKYRICVWYFGLFTGDGSDLRIMLQYSDDGGLTFTKQAFLPNFIPNNDYGRLSIAAMKPVLDSNGNMNMGCFYIKKNNNTFASAFDGYDIYYIYGSTTSTFFIDIGWSVYDINSQDWTIHSIATFYLNGKHHVVFAGFRNILDTPPISDTFSLWSTTFLNIQGTQNGDLWSPPMTVMPGQAPNSLNGNGYTYPTAYVINGLVNVVVKSMQIESLESSGLTETNTTYVLVKSDDGITFSYPSVFIGTDGSQFSIQFDVGKYAYFVPQSSYLYLGSGGYMWDFIQNNVVADVSADIIGYKISEGAGQPSSINIQIANANNKWFGQNPTGPGASAMQRNRKIALWQGYYTGTSTTEVVPRNVYYIDDIQQQVTSTQNDVTVTGRDLYKKMKTTVTKFSYQFTGPYFYTDIFDGTTNSNWNQAGGTWTFASNPGIGSGFVISPVGGSTDASLTLAAQSFDTFGHIMRVFFLPSATGTAHFYGMFIDADNWLRLEINVATSAWAVKKNIAGVITTMDSGTLGITVDVNFYYMITVRRYAYFTFQFLFAFSGFTPNVLQTYSPANSSYIVKNSTDGNFDMSTYVTTGNHYSLQSAFSVGFGADDVSFQGFNQFQLSILNNSSNVGEVTRALARIAGIFSFKIVNTFRELMYLNDFNGTYTTPNRILTVLASNTVMSRVSTITNGEVDFRAKLVPTDSSINSGFRFIFRADSNASPTSAYYFHLVSVGGTGGSTPFVYCRFERLFNLTTYIFYNTSSDVSQNPANIRGVNIDPTQWHDYRIIMIDGQLYAFIDGVMVASFNDDTQDTLFLDDPNWGFSTDANTTLSVQNITAPILWKPVPTFSFNSGDDAESAVESLSTSLMFWFFSDMLGRFKAMFLQSSDEATYTYDSQLYSQQVDQSDKEYISQVTVYGTGVIATSRNTDLMTGAPIRDMTVVDYKIDTQQDAQTRADNELIMANQYLNQNVSRQVVNVGAEMFDVVTVINTGGNTSGVDGPTRVYDQQFNQGGGSNNSDYSLEIDTGNV